MSIQVRNISKSFGAFKALNNVSITFPDGELVALLGPSGSGKSTLLRVIAGLEEPDQLSPTGEPFISLQGKTVTREGVAERGIGFVFQHYALFKHMTVFENIAFGLRVRPRASRHSKSDIAQRVHELLKLMQIEGYEKRLPAQLSGGQRQRVALARALATQPRVLLLDEPFGALDAKVRQDLRRWLRKLHDEIHVTSVFVTHDQEEALEVADRIVVMHQGKIEQEGTPEEVFHKPQTPFVAEFLGSVNLFHGRPEAGGNQSEKPVVGEGATTRFYIRPHEIDLFRIPDSEDGSGTNTASGTSIASHIGTISGRVRPIKSTVSRVRSAGSTVKVEVVDENEQMLEVELTHDRFRELGLSRGAKVYAVPRDVLFEDYAI